jgi:primosomal protein N'
LSHGELVIEKFSWIGSYNKNEHDYDDPSQPMSNATYIRVIIDRSIHRELDYLVPETLAEKVSIGSRVRVPFREKSALATVVALLTETAAEGIRPIEALVGDKPVLSPRLIELARWMGEIDRLTATVEGVSFRTNLLAINAAIEAARAGEKGAGFAVVADEVRQMAQISTRAAKEIRGAIGGAAAELGAASAQAEETKKIVGRLDQNLRNLRNETATLPAISGTAPAAVPLQPGMARNDAAQHRARA